jgi:hypothetical protein
MCKFISFTLNDILLFTEEKHDGNDVLSLSEHEINEAVEEKQDKWIKEWASLCNRFYAIALLLSVGVKVYLAACDQVVANNNNVQPQDNAWAMRGINCLIFIGFFVYFVGCDGVVTFIGQVLVQKFGRITEHELGKDPIEGALGSGIVVGGITFVTAVGLVQWMKIQNVQQYDGIVLQGYTFVHWQQGDHFNVDDYERPIFKAIYLIEKFIFVPVFFTPAYPIIAIVVLLVMTAWYSNLVMVFLAAVALGLRYIFGRRMTADTFKMTMVLVYGPLSFSLVGLKWGEALKWLLIENDTTKAQTINSNFRDVGMASGMISPIFFLVQSCIVFLAKGDNTLSFIFNFAAKLGTAVGRVSAPQIALGLWGIPAQGNQVVVIYYYIAAVGLVILAGSALLKIRAQQN